MDAVKSYYPHEKPNRSRALPVLIGHTIAGFGSGRVRRRVKRILVKEDT